MANAVWRSADPAYPAAYASAAAEIDATEEICRLMAEQRVSRTELARRAGIARSTLGRLLSGRAPLTLAVAARLAHALGHRLDVRFVAGGES